ncbi:hypothetical protein F4778DRAFT_706498 [Xylariomycetidae sp. FL2044]|nr:hypothetical protein F4778DRAFT_706498 [Xylariomycetidae sp. FL2044]
MYEPLATNLGTAGLLRYLNGLQEWISRLNGIERADPQGVDLSEQIKDLVAITVGIDELATRERRHFSTSVETLSANDLVHLHAVCNSIRALVQECTDLIEPLKSAIEDIVTRSDQSAYASTDDGLAAHPWYSDTYGALKIRTEALRVMLSCITLMQHKTRPGEDGNLSREARASASTLQYQIALVQPKIHIIENRESKELRIALSAAKGVSLQTPLSLNKHFLVGRAVKSFYTGRQAQMAKIIAAFDDSIYMGQKRFVIYGLGGSGKTELALKYAEDHMQSFWGVFLVDASSRKNATGSYCEIAKIGGVEPNEKAAKNWLVTRALPWLLIIDNADDDEIPLHDMIPAGTRGCILITSRNPAHMSYGTVGERHLELLPMELGEANELILKAAEEPSPWTKPLKESASVICQALGFLPLALVHAGKAILLGLCSWQGYLGFYDRHTERIRRDRRRNRDRSLSRNKRRAQEDDDSMNVFSSYEILYESLERSSDEKFQDAIELLQVFSYLHHQNLRVDVLIKAAINPIEEEKARDREAQEFEQLRQKIPELETATWCSWFRQILIQMLRHIDSPPPLLSSLKNPEGLGGESLEGDVNDRLRLALTVLVQRSLIMSQDRAGGRYCMHPLVHKWVRERAGITTAQQALWCQVATTTLARSILLPPLGDTEIEREMRRELLPHILHVQGCHEVINNRLGENRASRRSFWPVVVTGFGRMQALEAARFSRVYSECGLFQDALSLQQKVRDFATGMLGADHPLSIKITLVLAGTLYELSRASEATKLQRQMHETCLKSLSKDHPLTLMVTDMLASSLCFLGQWRDSLSLHDRAVEGLTRIYGKSHENTLKAIRNLGRVHLRHMEFEKASELHHEAWDGMKSILGEAHPETLICLEDLAMSRLRLGEKHLAKCHDMMKFVLEQRRRILGKEQPYTLLAICNLGRVKSALGQHVDAASIMQDAVVIAERNLGENHFGVLAGKTHYAQVLVNQGRCEEAETIFRSVIQRPQYEKSTDDKYGEHPDRLIALWYLTGCLEKQGKLGEALEICQGIMKSLREIGGRGLGAKHKFASMVQKEIEKVKELMLDTRKASSADITVPSEL